MSDFDESFPVGNDGHSDSSKEAERRAARLAEFGRRFRYILCSFRLGLETVSFNASLARLKRTVRFGRQSPGRGDRVHPFLEIVINHRARELAARRSGAPDAGLTQADVDRAAAWVASNVAPVRGRPRAQLLDHHVGGLMALIEQYCGQPLIARRNDSTGNYDPRLIGPARILLHLKEVDPSITETQLVNKVRQIRRSSAGSPRCFRDVYPMYGAIMKEDGTPALTPPFRLINFERSVPIYCP